jgi:FixJ family two-component response regulator
MGGPNEKIWVYVIDDDPAVLKSLCALLNAHGYATTPCASAENFLRVYDPALKACLLLDMRLPGMSGAQLQAHLTQIGISLPTIILTAHGDVPVAVKSMRAGAIDFIEKPARVEEILAAIKLAAGMLFNRQPAMVSKKIVADRLSKLTDREKMVMHHLLQGKLNKEIANELGVSQRTVEGHRARIREKMQARGIADLIRMLG